MSSVDRSGLKQVEVGNLNLSTKRTGPRRPETLLR